MENKENYYFLILGLLQTSKMESFAKIVNV